VACESIMIYAKVSGFRSLQMGPLTEIFKCTPYPRMGLTQPAVSRGERIAKENKYKVKD
jgi:hypothetical protein